MIKLLLKKQMAELGAGLLYSKKAGTKRSVLQVIGFALLFLLVFASFSYVFFMLADSLISPFVQMDMGWLAFSLMGMIATAIGVFIGIFTVHSAVYEPKDNNLLLSMPIKPAHILLSRMVGCYLYIFLFQLFVLVPTTIVYFMAIGSLDVLTLLLAILAVFLLPLFTLALSSALAYLVALLSARMSDKTVITTVASLLFIVAYYYVYFQGQKYLQYVLNNADKVGGVVKGAFYPFYCFGKGLMGDALSFLLFALIMVLPFVAVYYLLSRSFIKLATTKRGSAKKVYVAKKEKARSAFAAVLCKEFSRLFHSSVYMLNCCLSTLLMVVAVVALLIYAGDINKLLPIIYPGFGRGFVTLILCAAVCALVSMNTVSAPSISLEGQSLWIIKSLPIKASTILAAKMAVHLALTLIPSFVLAVVAAFVVKLSPAYATMLLFATLFFNLFTAAFGLFLNLKMPNFSWTNETVAVKQSAAVLIEMLGSMAVLIGLGVLSYSLWDSLSPSVILVLCISLVALAAIGLNAYMFKKSEKLIKAL